MSKFWIALALTLLSFYTAQKVYALFSDSVTLTTDIIISTGEVEFDIEDLNGKPLNIENLLPGEWSEEGSLNLVNQPNGIPLKTYMHVANLSGKICGNLNIKLDVEFNGTRDTIYEDSLEELNGENDSVELTVDELETLEPGESLKIYQSVQLGESIKENLQGEGCTWDEVFTGKSTIENDD